MAHANVFVGFEGVTNVNFGVGGGDKFHATNLRQWEMRAKDDSEIGN